MELCAVASLATLYSLWPVLSVGSAVGTGIDGIYGVKATIVETGTPISDVVVQCVTNKVTLENRFTLEFDKFVSVDEYSVGSVKPGESFTTNCTFAWSMWEKSGQQGLLILGYPTPGQPNPGGYVPVCERNSNSNQPMPSAHHSRFPGCHPISEPQAHCGGW